MLTRSWKSFVESSRSEVKKANRKLWRSGVPARSRSRVWTSAIEADAGAGGAGAAQRSDSAISTGFGVVGTGGSEGKESAAGGLLDLDSQIETLETSQTFSSLSTGELAAVRALVGRETNPPPGFTQIVAQTVRLLGGGSASAEAASRKEGGELQRIASHLAGVTRGYFREGSGTFRDDFAVLLELLRSETPKLCSRFDALELDVTDVYSVVEIWMGTLLSEGFPAEFGARVLDIVMIEGPRNLIFLIYALLKTNESTMLEAKDCSEMFNILTGLPGAIKDPKATSAVFTLAYDAQKKMSKDIEKWRLSARWDSLLGGVGGVPFVAAGGSERKGGSGADKALAGDGETGSAASPLDDLVRNMNEDSEDEDTHRDRIKLVNTLEQMKAQTENPIGKRALEQALEELRAYDASRSRAEGTWYPGNGDSRRDVKQNRGRGGGGGGGTGTDSSRGSTLDSAQRERIAKGFIPYSRLYQFQDFPCLYMEGYLQKRREGKSGDLHKRFFVLHGSYLTHFRSHEHRRSQRDIAVSVKGAKVSSSASGEGFKYGFEIVLADGTPFNTLFAEDEHQQQVWISVLRAAAQQGRA